MHKPSRLKSKRALIRIRRFPFQHNNDGMMGRLESWKNSSKPFHKLESPLDIAECSIKLSENTLSPLPPRYFPSNIRTHDGIIHHAIFINPTIKLYTSREVNTQPPFSLPRPSNLIKIPPTSTKKKRCGQKFA